jgi:drug/metabolite transporter (DMT)-like permease
MTDNKRGVFYVLLVALLWSTVGVASKFAVRDMSFLAVALYVGVFATVFLFINLVIRKKTSSIRAEFSKQPAFFLFNGVIGFGLQQVVYMKAYAVQSAAQTVIIYYFYPLLMIILAAVLFGEKTSARSGLLVFLGFLGVCVVVSHGNLSQFQFTFGALFAFCAALCWALFSVLVKHRKFDIEIGMFLFSLFGEVFLTALIPLWGFDPRLTLPQAGVLFYLAAFTMAIGFVLWNKALHLTRTSVCANIALMVPLVSILLISFILKERLDVFLLIGLVLIVGSAFITMHLGAEEGTQSAPGGVQDVVRRTPNSWTRWRQ